jgi:hypothetical protein
MRFLTLLVLSVVGLTLAPAVAQKLEPPPEMIAKIAVRHLDARRFFDTLQVLPTGIKGVYAMPQGDALIVSGSASAIGEMKAAVLVADVAAQEDLVVTLRHANPESIRAAALALPQPGTMEVRDKTIRFAGQRDWLEHVRGLIFGAELTNPQAMTRHRGEGGAPKR